MKRNLGEVFREIRESKNLKLLDVCGADLSLSQLSRFERGKCEISANKLFYALEKINVSVEEYILAINGYQENYIDELFSKLNEYHLQNNVKMMKLLLKKEQNNNKYSEKSIYKEMNCLLISVRIQQIDPTF
ncbi:TPA: helix-turn-helix transcriptional regulator, partial [Bacillus cytotoxicus]|nr:helix-turn-helix transcriptional regulator [Bacillus cytotoxicus]